MNAKQAALFDITEEQIISMYGEILLLSKKSPDSPINKFKLAFINELLVKANELLSEEYIPFKEFRLFDDATLPTASDIVFVLSQYLALMDKYRFDNTSNSLGNYYWIVSGEESNIKTKKPKFSE